MESMFTPEERDRLRSELLEYAGRDPRISGAAITGSAAAGCEDRWSDIDLAFGVSTAAEVPDVLADWTAHMYRQHLVLHHLDVVSGAWIYRVFFLPNTLQVDLAFVPETKFRALAPTFRLMFGKANEPRHFPPPPAGDIILETAVANAAAAGWRLSIATSDCSADSPCRCTLTAAAQPGRPHKTMVYPTGTVAATAGFRFAEASGGLY